MNVLINIDYSRWVPWKTHTKYGKMARNPICIKCSPTKCFPSVQVFTLEEEILCTMTELRIGVALLAILMVVVSLSNAQKVPIATAPPAVVYTPNPWVKIMSFFEESEQLWKSPQGCFNDCIKSLTFWSWLCYHSVFDKIESSYNCKFHNFWKHWKRNFSSNIADK